MRSAIVDCALLLMISASAAMPAGDTTTACAPIAGVESLLRSGTVVLLGEIHGTVEAPALVADAVCLALEAGLSVTVALELPGAEQPSLVSYLESAGDEQDRAALLARGWWRDPYQDGRASEAMLTLIEELRRRHRAGAPVALQVFDRPGAGRERAMAAALAEIVAAAPRDLVLVLTGNLHARLASGLPVRGRMRTMGQLLIRALPERRIMALRLRHAGGSAWVCSDEGCGERSLSAGAGEKTAADDGKEARRVVIGETVTGGYHGYVDLGRAHASPPAVDAADRGETSSAGIDGLPSPSPPPTRAGSSAPDTGARAPVLELPPATPAWTTSVPGVAAPSPHPSEPPAADAAGLDAWPDDGGWPRFLGPRGDGAAAAKDVFPAAGTPRLVPRWRRSIGEGYSSAAVSDGLAVTLSSAALADFVVAFDLASGDERWRVALPRPTGHLANAVVLSTPSVAAGRVFALGPGGRLVAVRSADGSSLWQRDLVADFDAVPPSYGMSTSPLAVGELVVVLVGGREGHNLVAFDQRSGEVAWSAGHADLGSYGSPVLGTLAGEPQIVVPAGDALYAVDPADGRLLWRLEGLGYPEHSPLVVADDRVLMAFDDGAVMLRVVPAGSEVEAGWRVEELWRSADLKRSYGPVLHHRGALFGFDGAQLVCLDAATGRPRWREPLGGGTQILVGGHLLVLGASGTLHLVRASPTAFEERLRLPIWPLPISAFVAPSFTRGLVVLRDDGEVVVLAVEPSPAG